MFTLRIVDEGHAVLAGRLDASQAEAAVDALGRLAGPTVLDCAGLDYISSAGLGVLVETWKRLRASGHTLLLRGLQPRVKNIFVLANLDTLMQLE